MDWRWVLAAGEGRVPSSGQGRLCFSVMVSSFLQFRLVVKTALKLLLVFVEYSESNAPLLIQAVSAVDTKRGEQPLPWGHQGHGAAYREASRLLLSYWEHSVCRHLPKGSTG